MRILFIDDLGSRLGGVRTYLANLLPALEAKGHVVGLCGPSGTRSALGDQVIREYPRNPVGWSVYDRALWNLLNPFAAARIRQTMAEFKPDVVHLGGCTTHLGLAALKALEPVPTVYMAHNYEIVCPQQTPRPRDPSHPPCDAGAGWICVRGGCRPFWKYPADRAIQWVSKQARRCIDHVIAPSTMLADWLRRAGWTSITHLPTGIPLGQFQEGRRGQVIIYVGRLSPEKGPQVLLRAMPHILLRLPKCQAWFAGDGPLRGPLIREAESLGISASVLFLGPVPHTQLPSVHARAGALAGPSVCAENFSLSLAEAQAWGTPVVASNIGGIPDLVRHGETGLLFRPNDPEDLAGRICEILGDVEHARELARNARAFAERHLSLDVYVDSLVGIYQQVVEKARGSTHGGLADHA